MPKLLLVAFTVTISLLAASTAEARGGCGLGYHRGPYGGCRVNDGGGPAIVVAPGVGRVVVVPGGGGGRACPVGFHLGPYGHCRANY